MKITYNFTLFKNIAFKTDKSKAIIIIMHLRKSVLGNDVVSKL